MFISQNIHIRPFLINWTFVYSIYRALKMDPLATIPSFASLQVQTHSSRCAGIIHECQCLLTYFIACNPLP